MADPIRILLVDDHPLMLMGIRAMLEGQTDIEIVGTAADGAKALAMLASMERLPNVMLLDIMMPGMDGIELARRMRAEMPDVSLLVLSSDTSLATLEPLLNIGIDGFLSKGSDKQTMLSAIRSVAAGYEFFGTDIARLIERISFAKKASDSLFTPRELDVIRLSCKGLQYKEIAGQLGIKYLTVVTIKNNIFRKLGINNTVELVLYAIKKELITL
ncbi:MAG: response regulator transcription factor [Bacteroidales bacterium]|nr:response regulator transcription factor [Bacteroidales bacterium]